MKTFSGIALKFLQFEQTTGSTKENNDVEICVPKFSFDEWANELGLKGLITQELRKEELVTKEALSLVELKDLKELNFPLGVIKIIMNGFNKMEYKIRH